MGVDVRTGSVGVEVEPSAEGEGVKRELGELERGMVKEPLSLPGHLSRLQ